jgi:hypothetical protein
LTKVLFVLFFLTYSFWEIASVLHWAWIIFFPSYWFIYTYLDIYSFLTFCISECLSSSLTYYWAISSWGLNLLYHSERRTQTTFTVTATFTLQNSFLIVLWNSAGCKEQPVSQANSHLLQRPLHFAPRTLVQAYGYIPIGLESRGSKECWVLHLWLCLQLTLSPESQSWNCELFPIFLCITFLFLHAFQLTCNLFNDFWWSPIISFFGM